MSANYPPAGRPQGWNANQPPMSRPTQPNAAQQPGFAAQPPMSAPHGNAQQPPKKRGRWLWIAIVGVLVVALAVFLIWNFSGGGKQRQDLAEQWAAQMAHTPNGEVAIMEWRDGPTGNDISKPTYYLDLYWYDGSELNYYTEHPMDSAQNGPVPGWEPVQGMGNVKILDEHLADFQKYIDSAPCDTSGGKFWVARMMMLPDGAPMFTHKCDTAFNTNRLPATRNFSIDGVEYSTKFESLESELDKIIAVARHFEMPFAKLESTGGAFKAGSDLQQVPSYALAVPVNAPMLQPIMTGGGTSAKATHYLNFATLDRELLHARIADLQQRGLKPSVSTPLRIEQLDESTVVIGITSLDGTQGTWLDKDGNEVRR